MCSRNCQNIQTRPRLVCSPSNLIQGAKSAWAEHGTISLCLGIVAHRWHGRDGKDAKVPILPKSEAGRDRCRKGCNLPSSPQDAEAKIFPMAHAAVPGPCQQGVVLLFIDRSFEAPARLGNCMSDCRAVVRQSTGCNTSVLLKGPV